MYFAVMKVIVAPRAWHIFKPANAGSLLWENRTPNKPEKNTRELVQVKRNNKHNFYINRQLVIHKMEN